MMVLTTKQMRFTGNIKDSIFVGDALEIREEMVSLIMPVAMDASVNS